MSFQSFIESVLENGRTQVVAPGEIGGTEKEAVSSTLIEAERVHRANLPAGLPQFDVDAAVWAGEMLFRVAQFFAYRDVNAEFITAALRGPRPDSGSASAHYSVDLCLRYLPDLHRLASHTSSTDPLLEEIETLLEPWPLSRVGLSNTAAPVWHAAIRQPALRKLYVDRIIEKHDERLLSDPHVRDAVRVAIGAFPDLAPKAAASVVVATEEEPMKLTTNHD